VVAFDNIKNFSAASAVSALNVICVRLQPDRRRAVEWAARGRGCASSRSVQQCPPALVWNAV